MNVLISWGEAVNSVTIHARSTAQMFPYFEYLCQFATTIHASMGLILVFPTQSRMCSFAVNEFYFLPSTFKSIHSTSVSFKYLSLIKIVHASPIFE